MKKSSEKKIIIVLDLDQTIIHTISDDAWLKLRKAAKDGNNVDLLNRMYEVQVEDETIRGVIRDNTEEFLDYLFSNFLVGVYSAGVRSYVTAMVNILFSNRDLYFVYSREDCKHLLVSNDIVLCKPLEFIFAHNPKANKYNTILIDDREDVTYYNRLNIIIIPEFIPHATNKDNRLLKLIHHFKVQRVYQSSNVQVLRSSQKLIFN